ncbi:MAG: 2-methoxy-6-polyprenyl-1,4-benzoquinol methylase, mitochondrial [Dehalococcoides mccartyi]|nr:2-methoxy-6-polyprenyl-1,4-benzoquinol methylase, mitochondrial [Dehalococcoides mccartyi]
MVAPSFFEKVAPVYEFLTRMFMLGTFESARDRMLNEDTSAFSVLDLCTGTGYIANKIEAKRIVGLDQSVQMMALNDRTKRPNKTLVRGNAYHLPFEAGEFERIYCSSASHEFKLFGKVLAECFRTLKPGGKVAVYDIYQPKNKFYSLIVNTIYRYPVEHNIMWVHTLEEWRKLLTEAGFEVEELEAVRGVFVFVRARKPV